MYIDSSKITGQSLTYSSSTLQKQNANAATLPLTESEQRQLAAWNTTRQDNPQDMCIPLALINNYEPSKATVVATCGHAPPTAHSTGSPNISRSSANTQIYILDIVQIKVTGYT